MNNPLIPNELKQYLDHGKKLLVLDGLRGYAITLVIFFHCAFNGPEFFPRFSTFFSNFGWSGVDLFFVLSGFLITNILLQTKNQKHYFKNFYLRRILRIFPLYYAFLLFHFLYYNQFHGFFYHIFYVSNFYLINAADIPSHTPAWLTWSLAIEEQFYLMWPLIICLLKRRLMVAVNIFFIIGAFILRFQNYSHHVQPFESYVSIFTRIDTISYGALIALMLNMNRNLLRPLKETAWILLGILPVFIYWIWADKGIFYYAHALHTPTFGFSFIAMLYASILVIAISSQSKLIDYLLKNRLILLIGKHSYCMYLIHVEIIFFWKGVFKEGSFIFSLFAGKPLYASITFNTIVFISTLLLSIVIWHVYEKHFINMKKNFAYKIKPS